MFVKPKPQPIRDTFQFQKIYQTLYLKVSMKYIFYTDTIKLGKIQNFSLYSKASKKLSVLKLLKSKKSTFKSNGMYLTVDKF